MGFFEFLEANNYISDDILDIVAAENCASSSNLYDTIIELGIMQEKQLADAKASFFQIPSKEIEFSEYDENSPFNRQFCIDNLFIPIKEKYPNIREIAIYDPGNILLTDNIKKAFNNMKINFVIATKSNIIKILTNRNEIKRKYDYFLELLDTAAELKASDIHISPQRHMFVIQLRIDGILTAYKSFHKNDFSKLCVKIKVMANLDISENRRPQSGHFSRNSIDFRVSFHPTKNGENIVLRILGKMSTTKSIETLGFTLTQVAYLKKIAQYANGLIIFCGPTGSGKTTSIYSILDTIDKKSKNIMTLEDPVEYNIQNVKQTQIKPGIIDFISGIKSILRQDPDVIFIGEVRDEETARMALRASMTGHLVFTTVHSNDSFGAIMRFIEFGIQKSILCDNIISVISQRLVRKRNTYSEYQGRTVISEILRMDQTITNKIIDNKPKDDILQYAKENLGFKTIQEDCEEKINNGITTKEEMSRILRI